MYTKTTKQLIRDAKLLAGVLNSDFTDFQISTSLLNDCYREMYDKLSEEGNFFIEYESFEGKSFALPDDCYRVLNVYKKEGEKLFPITANSPDQFIDGTYYIENNAIYINTNRDNDTYTIRYSTLPMTLTAPDNPVELPVTASNATFGKMTDDGVYLQTGGVSYYWDFATNEVTQAAFQSVQQPYYFLGKNLVVTTSGGKVTSMLWGNSETEEIVDYFKLNGLDIASVVVSDPYIFVNYTDNHIAVFNAFNGTEWNQLDYTGKTTLGRIVAAWTNDSTGKGVIFYNLYTQKYYYCSFVPDTVLKYPTNTFFSLLEYKLAVILGSMLGMPNDYIANVKVPEAEEAFYATLRKDGYAPVRISNVWQRR